MNNRVFVVGSTGRMGTFIMAEARAGGEFAEVEPWLRHRDPASVECEKNIRNVVVDFSVPDALATSTALARRLSCPLLVGTTGLLPAHEALLEEASAQLAVMHAPNTSIGIAVMSHLVAEASRLLPETFDVSITDVHHRAKRDAPSGTALHLARCIRDSGRTSGELPPIFAIRSGDVPGTHDVLFAGDRQQIVLRHVAESREVFARGAIRAAHWLLGRAPGRYQFDEVVGLSSGAEH